jgi:hypothetical protein
MLIGSLIQFLNTGWRLCGFFDIRFAVREKGAKGKRRKANGKR